MILVFMAYSPAGRAVGAPEIFFEKEAFWQIPGSGSASFARFQVPVPPVQSRYTTVTVSSEVPGSGSADPAEPGREQRVREMRNHFYT